MRPRKSVEQQEVRRKALPYQPISLRESNSFVRAGRAVAMIVRS